MTIIMSSSSAVLSSFSWKGYAAAGFETRISSFNLFFSPRINFMGSSNPHKSAPLINNMPMMSRGVHTMSQRTPSPWLMLPPAAFNEENENMIYNFYKLAEKEVVSFEGKESLDLNYNMYMPLRRGKGNITDYEADLVGSSHGWLALFQRYNMKLFLTDPVSRPSIELPSLDNLAGLFAYYYSYSGCGVKNVVLSCSPDKEECRAMMIFAHQDRLAFCCPARGLEWAPIGHVYDQTRNPRRYQSVVYSSKQKLFFSVTKSLEFEAWDLSDPSSPLRISMDDVKLDKGKSLLACEAFRDEYEAKAEDISDRPFLVIAGHSDEIFLVRRFVMLRMGADGLTADKIDHGQWNNKAPHKTIGFDVHKYDPVTRAFKYIDTGGDHVHEYHPELKAIKYTGGGGGSSLDGLALFIGANNGFALRADEYPELKPNSIYFTDTEYVAADLDPDDEDYDDDYDKHERRRYGGHDLGIFSYPDGTFSPCYYPCDYGNIQKIRPAPTWFTSNTPL